MTGGLIRGFQDTGYLCKKIERIHEISSGNVWGRAWLDQINGILIE